MGFNSGFKGLRHCATNGKVACTIPFGVIEFFIDITPPGSEYFLGVKTVDHLHVLIVMKSGSLKFLEPLGPVLELLCVHNNLDYPKYLIILHELTAVSTLPVNDLHINGF